MPKADDNYTGFGPGSSRRALLAAAGALTARTALPFRQIQADDGDMELLRLCHVFRGNDAVQRHMDAHGREFTDDQFEEIRTLWCAAVNLIIRTPAATREGLVAKATVLRAVLNSWVPVQIGDTVEDAGELHELLAWSLVGDVVRVA